VSVNPSADSTSSAAQPRSDSAYIRSVNSARIVLAEIATLVQADSSAALISPSEKIRELLSRYYRIALADGPCRLEALFGVICVATIA
jgi:hypothetical protein